MFRVERFDIHVDNSLSEIIKRGEDTIFIPQLTATQW